ncbi:hypothetical protein MB46_04120 [Arthrobacter alpinus]|nr:hypothetical protein MB46_04120 [Arthrobacter alpinus]
MLETLTKLPCKAHNKAQKELRLSLEFAIGSLAGANQRTVGTGSSPIPYPGPDMVHCRLTA